MNPADPAREALLTLESWKLAVFQLARRSDTNRMKQGPHHYVVAQANVFYEEHD